MCMEGCEPIAVALPMLLIRCLMLHIDQTIKKCD